MPAPKIRTQAFLANLPLFRELSPEEIDRLAQGTTEHHVARGSVIVNKGASKREYLSERTIEFQKVSSGVVSLRLPEGDTTGFVVADGAGNVASVIQSLFNSYGSGVVAPGLP